MGLPFGILSSGPPLGSSHLDLDLASDLSVDQSVSHLDLDLWPFLRLIIRFVFTFWLAGVSELSRAALVADLCQGSA